jgi:alpha-galactosidase
MGFNDWYAYYSRVSDADMRKAADVLISSGMADVGYQYVNVDDCWMGKRDADGNITGNEMFPDMKALADYIHRQGLKAGIYTSPGPKTCAGYEGAWKHEAQDARTFAQWGYDFLKYDWCSYGNREGLTLDAFQKPFRLMGDLLKQQDRDIVFNLCQYGMGDVWKWGADVRGNSWRTSDDLGGELDRIFEVALKNCALRQYNKRSEERRVGKECKA